MVLQGQAPLTTGKISGQKLQGNLPIGATGRRVYSSEEWGNLMPIRRFRIQSPTIALFFEDGRHVARTVPGGSVIQIDSEVYDDNKLVNVVWNERTVMMFAQDVRSRGEEIEENETQERG
jgi:hypothetical protein